MPPPGRRSAATCGALAGAWTSSIKGRRQGLGRLFVAEDTRRRPSVLTTRGMVKAGEDSWFAARFNALGGFVDLGHT